MTEEEEQQIKNEDTSILPGRFQEKSQLQELNQRYSNYVQLMRKKRNEEASKGTIEVDERKWMNQIEQQKQYYEQRLDDLREKFQDALKDRNEFEAMQMKFQAMSSEYEERFLSLNETVMKQADEISRLQMMISNKELEVQQAKNQLTGPRTELDICRVERDDFRKRLAESERRFQAEVKAKTEFQQQLTDLHSRCSREMRMYQKEINDLHARMERSQQVILELEESTRKSGQRDSEVAEMMRKTREASEMELKRYIEEAEAKHHLDISEIKMRMEADMNSVTSLIEENGKLQAELNATRTALQVSQSELASMESAFKVSQTNLDSERKHFELQIKKMERKLQETQDLLLIKMQELTAALDANIPLKAEIDMLRGLIEEEEKRLGLDTLSIERAAKTRSRSTSYSQQTPDLVTDGLSGKGTASLANNGDDFTMSKQNTVNNTTPVYTANIQSVNTSNANSGVGNTENKLFYPSTRNRTSLPLTTQGFKRGSAGMNAIDLFTPPNNAEFEESKQSYSKGGKIAATDAQDDSDDEDDNDDFDTTVGELISRSRNSNSGRNSAGSGINQLPTRPDNPTPPKMLPRRPASAVGCRYIAADAGQGRDYFDAMFNDLRKDTMYSKMSEEGVGSDTTKVLPSTHHDLVNSTSSATGCLKLIDVDESGRYVRIHNTSSTMVEDVGGYLLQQNVAGHPVAVFRFPPRTKLQQGHTATVWSGGCKEGIHDPPTHYVWKQLDKWGTGPECTTILCRPNGQAVAWMTSAPRVSRISKAFHYHNDEKSQAAEVAKLMKELHAQQTLHTAQLSKEQNNWESVQQQNSSESLPMPYPATYSERPSMYDDSASFPEPSSSILKREKMLPASSRLLPTRTGSAPLRKYVVPPSPFHPNSKPQAFQQRLATNGDAELIDLTTQRSARSKYGFDFMTHAPKVTNYDGTVRDR